MCKLMKTFLTLFIFTISSNIFAMQDDEAAPVENIKPIRIGFYIDNNNEAYSSGVSYIITYEFAAELHQNFLDVIIVSDYIFKNIILRKYTEDSDPNFTRINFNLNDWDIYYIKNTQFFVFVQPGYNNPILNKTLKIDGNLIWNKIDFDQLGEYTGDATDEERPIIKWKFTAPIKAKKLLSHEGLKYIPYAKDLKSEINTYKMPEKKFEPIQLSWIFKPYVGTYEERRLTQPCNMYITGHGGPYKGKHFIAGMPSDDMANLLLFCNDKLNTKSIRLSTCVSGGKGLDLMRIKNDIPIRIQYLLIVESIMDSPTASTYKIFKDYQRVDIKSYFEALEEFQGGSDTFVKKLQAIKTKKRLLSGEAEQEIKDEIQELEENSGFNGILKSLPLTQDWYYKPSGINNFPQIWIPEIGWFQTFNVDPYVKKITDKNITATSVNSISKMEVTHDQKASFLPNLFKMLFPEEETQVLHLDFDFQRTLQFDKCFALLLYSEIVYLTLKISPNIDYDFIKKTQPNRRQWLLNLHKYFPSQSDFCIYPQIIAMQRGDSLNLFAKICILKNSADPLIENGILNFLRDSFFILRDRISTNKFFIKELEGFNDFSEILDKDDPFKKELDAQNLKKKPITLQNVFIENSMESTFWGEFTNIKLSFEFNEKPWVLYYKRQELALSTPNNSKIHSLWYFEKNGTGHGKNIKSSKLTYLAQLTPAEYYAQLPVIREMFHREKTNFQIKEPAKTLSLKDFIIKLKFDDIQKEIKQAPVIKAEQWKEFEFEDNQSELKQKLKDKTQSEVTLEQQFRLQMNLKRIKSSLWSLKEKLSMLKARLEQLEIKLHH